jgi:plasmid stability protein
MRKKIGTIIEDSLYRRLRVNAASEGRNVSDLIEESISAYLSVHEGSADERLSAFRRFTSPRFVLPRAQLDMVLEEDPLDQ